MDEQANRNEEEVGANKRVGFHAADSSGLFEDNKWQPEG
jgi:hypothetical protein